MSVTQSYKTITLSDDALLHVQLAVLTQMKTDRAAKRMPGDEYDKFLQQQVALGTEAMAALNAATVQTGAVPTREGAHGALAGEIVAADTAVVVKINGRYFCEFGKLGQVKTAWTIVGARLFFPGSPELGAVVKTLAEKGKKFEVMVLGVVA